MLKDLFTLSGRWGRLNRLRYFGYSVLANITAFVIILVLVFGLAGGSVALDWASLAGLLLLIIPLYFVLFWVAICLMVKRLHDLNQSGWWVLGFFGLSFVSGFVGGMGESLAIVSLITSLAVVGFTLWLIFWPGTKGDNQYGPDPLKMN